MMTEPITPEPMSSKGTLFALVIGAELAALWAVSLYAYATLPDEVVTHFGAAGKPTSYGDKSMFLFLPLAFSIAPAALFVVTRLRFTLINSYPYLVNLPAFFTSIDRIPAERRGGWVNAYFELVLALGAALSLFLLFLLLMIFKGTLDGRLTAWFMPVTMAFPVLLIIPFVYGLSRLSRRMQQEANG